MGNDSFLVEKIRSWKLDIFDVTMSMTILYHVFLIISANFLNDMQTLLLSYMIIDDVLGIRVVSRVFSRVCIGGSDLYKFRYLGIGFEKISDLGPYLSIGVRAGGGLDFCGMSCSGQSC